MIGFRRDPDGLVADLEEVEVTLLESLISQVNDLLGPAEGAEADDPFEHWAGSFNPSDTLDDADPVVARLFPDAYADDPVAAAEHRRFTQDEQRRERLRDGATVLADLNRTEGGRAPLLIPAGHTTAWLKTLTAVRLALAVRLGIEAEVDLAELEQLPVRDPRSQIVALYDWLAVLLELLLEAMAP
ncbi:MAG: DUF2017 family protein [Propioniciclava sp.]